MQDLVCFQNVIFLGNSGGLWTRSYVVYVWLDALTNYITKIGYDADGNSSDLFKKNWPADLHLIGKDIIRFIRSTGPIFLMALDLPPPKQVFGHPWLLQGGDKMSNPMGNGIYADDMVDLFGGCNPLLCTA